jgi:RNA polymerase sigma-70 factor (ECF subfamily)
MNRIRQELRRVQRRPEAVGLDEELLDDGPSPLEAAVGSETLRAYECALEGLSDEERALVVARVELGLTYSEIAATCGKVSPDAARMAVGRALVRLAEIMGEPSTPTD